MRTISAVLAFATACGGFAQAAPVISQNFDDTAVFKPNAPIAATVKVPDGTRASGNNPGANVVQPAVTSEQSRSAGQSVKVVRGGNGEASSAFVVWADDRAAVGGTATAEAWIRRDAGASFILHAAHRDKIMAPGMPAALVTDAGEVRIWNPDANAYVATPLTLPTDAWAGLRLVADLAGGTYAVAANTSGEWTTAAEKTPFLKETMSNANTVAVSPQAGTVYVDDLSMQADKVIDPANAPREARVYLEKFEDGPGGWFTWDGKPKAIEIHNGQMVTRSPWWVDPNHAPPGAGYLHLLMGLYTKSTGGDDLVAVSKKNRFVAEKFPTDFTNAKVTVRVKGNLDLKGAQVVFLAQSQVGDKAINSVLTGQPIKVTSDWTTQTLTLVPDDSQWTCLGSRHNRLETYGWDKIAPVLKNLNLDIVFVLFPLNVQPEGEFTGDKDKLYPDRHYKVDQSKLPSGEIWFDEVKIEFPAK